MNAYLRKEIRLLLPSFGFALVMALSVWLIPTESDTGQNRWVWLIMIPLLLCPALVVMTALDSFGREISSNTFSNLLAQPVSRARIWWTKTSLLAVALLTILAVWSLSFLLHLPKVFWSNSQDAHETFVVSVLLVMTVYSGGLWTVLCLRQVGAAFWFTVIIPAAVAMLTVYLTEKSGFAPQTERNVVIALVGYSIAGFVWARRLFLRAQDVHWTGGEITLPGWLKLLRRFIPTMKIAGRRPRLALFAKEFQLHQSQLIIAGLLALGHLALIALRSMHGDLKAAWGFEFVAFNFWTLWLVMPVLIGCAAVAEERKLGTLEAQLCLPASRRTQFLLKFGVALMLAIFFGVAVPVLLEAGRILPDLSSYLENQNIAHYEFPAHQYFAQVATAFLTPFLPLLSILPQLLLAASFVSIAFYASTLARNTLQAIAPAIMGILIAWALLVGGSLIEDLVAYPLWRGLLIYCIGIPVLTTVLAWLTYWNFKRVLVGWSAWRRNLVIFFSALAFVIVSTSAIYQRAWELFLPLDPPHGPVRLTATDAVSLKSDGLRLSAQFGDGQVWATRFSLQTIGFYEALLGGPKIKMLAGNSFPAGTNWSSVAFCARDVMALQRDGSLWVSAQPDNTRPEEAAPRQEVIKLVRYGNDSDWKSLVGRWTTACALKHDGSLWRIGTNRFSGKSKWPGLVSFAPHRLGTDTDWAQISALNDRMILRKTDGRVYVHPPYVTKPKETIMLADDMPAERAPNLEQQNWRALIWATSRRYGSFQVGVADDGKFCVTADYQLRQGQYEIVWQKLPLGSETNWLAVAGRYSTPATLKSDGTLWAWDFRENPVNHRTSAKATRLGTHSDWRAITAVAGGIVSLAADGSLWLWRFDEPYSNPTLLRPTRKPQLIGNVFANAE
jgi:ABC-type transport system involved in multi-copper enzyme maturation permease subunit